MNYINLRPRYETQNLFDDFFKDFWNTGSIEKSTTLTPSAKVVDKGNEFSVILELPGIKKEDIKVDVENSVLTISASKKEETKSEKDSVYFSELSFGEYKRSFKLSDKADAGNIKANYENGVLQLSVGKKENSLPKTIEVK